MRHHFIYFAFVLSSLLFLSCGVTSSSDSNPPVVEFKAGAVRIIDLPVTFRNETLGGSEFLWDFGNGTTSTEREPSVVYTAPGVYEITLEAVNAAGSTKLTRTVTILGEIPDTKTLDVPFRMMEGSWWAWAAATEMVLNYNGVKIQQCRMFKEIYGVECCDDPEVCRFTWRLDQVGTILTRMANMDWETQTARMTVEQIRMEIAQGRPIVAWIEDNVLNQGTYVVIYGYDAADRIMVHDPGYGSYTVAYDYSLGNVQEGYQWEYTIFNIEKRSE